MRVFSVSQVTGYIKRLIDSDMYLNDIYIKGEISNFKLHSGGHIYFTLKDGEAVMSGVMFRSNAARLKFMPENGMKVIVGGRISVYGRSGSYQLYAEEMEPAGKGELYLAYEQLKAELEKRGVFDAKYKKPIPKHPKCVAVITSPTGAAVRDIINVISRRNNAVEIVVVPTLVQGESAEEDIVSSIKTAAAWGGADTIILGRGGGSIEDLWAFNTVGVARAVFDCDIPIISAVGHETDFTITDFVADLRAPTPSAAAELAVPELNSLREGIAVSLSRMYNSVLNRLKTKQSLEQLSKRMENAYRAKCDRRAKLEGAVTHMNSVMTNKLRLFESRLRANDINKYGKRLDMGIGQHIVYLDKMIYDMEKNTSGRIDKLYERLMRLTASMNSNSPSNILIKGYSLAYSGDRLIKSVNDVKIDDNVKIAVADGEFYARVTAKSNESE